MWNEQKLVWGKIIKIRSFPRDKKVKVFWVTVSTNRTEYIATNDQSQSSNDDREATLKEAVEFETLHQVKN